MIAEGAFATENLTNSPRTQQLSRGKRVRPLLLGRRAQNSIYTTFLFHGYSAWNDVREGRNKVRDSLSTKTKHRRRKKNTRYQSCGTWQSAHTEPGVYIFLLPHMEHSSLLASDVPNAARLRWPPPSPASASTSPLPPSRFMDGLRNVTRPAYNTCCGCAAATPPLKMRDSSVAGPCRFRRHAPFVLPLSLFSR